MDIKELTYFKAVVDNGSILKASKELHISQPPLSRMMKNLENELNTQLFIRGKELKLTDSGKLLYEKALTIVELNNSLTNEIKELDNKNSQTLNIGIISSSTSLLYNNKLKNFLDQNPNVKYNITESNTFKLLDLLDKRLINLAITRTPFDKEIYNYVLLNKEPMVFTSNNKINEHISLKEISKYNVVIYRRFYEILTKLFKKNKLNLNIIVLVDDAKTAILMAKALDVHAIVPLGAYQTFSDNLYNSIIDEESLYTSLCVITRKNEIIEPIYQKFIDNLKK